MSNQVIELLQSHRSIRTYTDEPISDDILKTLFESAQWAPSSHNLQAYSIVVVKNDETKRQLARLCAEEGDSQKYVARCPVLW
ncbi:nitroreductase family protein [Gordoniibacillus kamchatkensis]|uniref:nitroreductase family protein n=1 Tax=Gordoniibacillus kamchatkensis TaxID=1590651 RepID=UPI000B1B5E3B|nr:nitroreductase family protein [Paenibacillus sp. VKM B-2647]